MKYAIRIPANENLERDIGESVTRPVGRPSRKLVARYKGFFCPKQRIGRHCGGGVMVEEVFGGLH